MMKVVDPKTGAEVTAPLQIWVIAIYSTLTEPEREDVIKSIYAMWPPQGQGRLS